jgi:hypothetical protein
MQKSQKCSLQVDLIGRLNLARSLYVHVLVSSKRPAHDDDVFDQVEAARIIYIVARNLLLEHRKVHGC